MLDGGQDGIVFFADDEGSWQVGVWNEVFPAWFRGLSKNAEPAGFADAVVETVEPFARDRHFTAARKSPASAAQMRSARGGLAAPARRR